MKGNMYKFVDMKWNPLGGECPHKCSYCSTKKFFRFPIIKEKYSGKPRLINSEFKSLGKNKTVFVCAQHDLFAKEIPQEFIYKILEHIEIYPENKYLFQTKNPGRYIDFEFYPEKSILCTTIESNLDLDDNKAPLIMDRIEGILEAKSILKFPTMITIEPIMKFYLFTLLELIKMANPDYINIGAVTGGHNLPEPSDDKVELLIKNLKYNGYNVNIKSNLERIYG